MAIDWFVVVTNPQRERFAAKNLVDHEPYFPQFKALTGRVKPLFPNYIFCRSTPYWSTIKNTVGVRTILMNGDNPAKLSQSVITGWKAQERHGLVVLPPPPRFRNGERLVVLRGTLRNRTVIHAGMSGRDRETVLLEMMGSLIKISIATDDLVSESERHARNSLRLRRETLIRRRSQSF